MPNSSWMLAGDQPCERLLRVSSPPSTLNIMDDNLKYMRTEAPLLAPIFRSDGQARLLAVLLIGDDELSVTDLAKRADLAYPTAHREVARLVEAGILSERPAGRTRLIRADWDSPLTGPLREILLVSAGPAALLTEELGQVDGVDVAFLYGSFAARLRGVEGASPHDVDVMVIGTPDVNEIYEVCSRVEAAVRRPVNPTILTAAELAEQSGFLESVRAGPIVPLVGVPPWR